MSDLRVLQFGLSGQLARALAQETPASASVLRLGRADVDLADEDAVESVVRKTGADIVVNAAAYTNVDGAEDDERAAFAVNAHAPAAMARALAERGGSLIHVSTDYVFSGDKQSAYLEGDATGPLNAYGRSKLAGEVAVSAALERQVTLRLSWLYSCYGKNFITTMLRLAADRDEISVVDDQRACPTSAHEAAQAIWLIIDAIRAGDGRWGVFHCGGQGVASWADLAEETFAQAAALGGASAKVRRISTADYPTKAERPRNSALDCSLLKECYGIEARPWRAGVQDALARLYDRNRTE